MVLLTLRGGLRACQEAEGISFPCMCGAAWANVGWMINELLETRSCVQSHTITVSVVTGRLGFKRDEDLKHYEYKEQPHWYDTISIIVYYGNLFISSAVAQDLYNSCNNYCNCSITPLPRKIGRDLHQVLVCTNCFVFHRNSRHCHGYPRNVWYNISTFLLLR